MIAANPSATTETQYERYGRDGFLVCETLLSQVEMEQLLARARDIATEKIPFPPSLMQVEPVVAKGATQANSKEESLRKMWDLCIHDEMFRALAKHPKIVAVVTGLLGPDVKLFRDALMMKPARVGSAKPYHQDSPYWPIDPPALVSAWIALDDAGLENGCMRVIPGSHHWGAQKHVHLEDFQVDESTLDLSKEVSVPLKPGGCLFFHSLLLHATAPNKSPRPRRAMILSYMRADSHYTCQPPIPNFLLICGLSFPNCV